MNIKKYYELRKTILEKIYMQRDIDFIKIDEYFVNEIDNYFKQAEDDEEMIEKLRKRKSLDPNSSLEYFRAMERIEIRKKIIQTLLSIALKKVPNIRDNIVFMQLYQLSEQLITLFNERDVYECSFKEFMQSDFLKSKIDGFKEFYDFNVKEINDNLKKGKENKDFLFILEALFLSALFWFTIREGKLERIRKSDLYIYLLSKKLKEEYKNS